MTDSLLRVRGLAKKFGRVAALRGVSFDLPARRLTIFLGANGAGKTTTLKIILGFLFADRGYIERALQNIRLGYVPEQPACFPWLKGKEILSLTAKIYDLSRAMAEKRVKELGSILCFDLALLERSVRTYSHGNQKKFAYLQNLLLDPDLLIVDEPFTALDPLAIKQVRELFLDYRRQGKTLFISTHLISEAEKLVDRVVIIREGQSVFEADWPDFEQNYWRIQVKKESSAAEVFRKRWPTSQERGGFLENFVLRPEWEEFLASSDSACRGHWSLECCQSKPDLESVFLFYSPPPASS